MEHVSKQREYTPCTRSPLLAFPSHVVLSPDTEFQYPRCAEGSSARLKVSTRWSSTEEEGHGGRLKAPRGHDFCSNQNLLAWKKSTPFWETWITMKPSIFSYLCYVPALANCWHWKQHRRKGINQVPWLIKKPQFFGLSVLPYPRYSVNRMHAYQQVDFKKTAVCFAQWFHSSGKKWICMYQLKNSNCAMSVSLHINEMLLNLHLKLV